jgi:hypothetical protein
MSPTRSLPLPDDVPPGDSQLAPPAFDVPDSEPARISVPDLKPDYNHVFQQDHP